MAGVKLTAAALIVPKVGAATTLTPISAYDTFEVANLTVTGVATFSGTLSVTGSLRLANGTAGAPSVAWTNSTTTGLFRQAADVVGVSISGTERYRISATLHDFGSAGLLVWGTALGSNDLGLARASAGVFEVNSGVAGTLRDLSCRFATLAAGTLADPATTLSITGTFNDAADTFAGVVLNFTVTAAAAPSTVFDVQVGGTGVLSVLANRKVTVACGTLPSGSGNALSLTATFNDGAATYKALRVSLTNTASAAASRAIDVLVASASVFAVDLSGNIYVAATQVVGAQGAAVADATDAATAISQLNLLLARCRTHGLIAT